MFDYTLTKGGSLFQAITTGLLVGLATGAGANLAGMAEPFSIGLALAAISAALTWLILLVRFLRLCEASAYGWAEPEAQPETTVTKHVETVRIELIQEAGRHVQIVDLPIDNDRLCILADGLAAGGSMSEAIWTGAGQPFTRAEFRQLRDEFIKRGWAAWRRPDSPAQGVILTKAGMAVMRHLSGQAATRSGETDRPSPTPNEDDTQTGGFTGGVRACVRNYQTL